MTDPRFPFVNPSFGTVPNPGPGFQGPGFQGPGFQGLGPIASSDITGPMIAAIANGLAMLQSRPAAMFNTPLFNAPQSRQHPGQAPEPDAEQQAASAFLHDLAAAAVRRLFDYFETAETRHSEVKPCYPTLHHAIQAYRERDYGRTLTLAYQVYRMVAVLRSRHPDLPALEDPAREDKDKLDRPAGQA